MNVPIFYPSFLVSSHCSEIHWMIVPLLLKLLHFTWGIALKKTNLEQPKQQQTREISWERRSQSPRWMEYEQGMTQRLKPELAWVSSPYVLWSAGSYRKTYLWVSHAAELITEVVVWLWVAGEDAEDEAGTCCMAIDIFAEARGIGGGKPTTGLVWAWVCV